ncbi:hypothetical protein L9F63_009382, partial [Diploptera punctata]
KSVHAIIVEIRKLPDEMSDLEDFDHVFEKENRRNIARHRRRMRILGNFLSILRKRRLSCMTSYQSPPELLQEVLNGSLEIYLIFLGINFNIYSVIYMSTN